MTSLQLDIFAISKNLSLLLKALSSHDIKNKINTIKNFKYLIVNLTFLYNNLYMSETQKNKIYYKITPTELTCINILIRTIQESINRGTFSDIETKNIYRTVDQLTNVQYHLQDQ